MPVLAHKELLLKRFGLQVLSSLTIAISKC